MKKLYTLILLVLFMVSCASSDSGSSSSDSKRLIKTIQHELGEGVLTTNYIYNGDKIVKWVDEETGDYFVYTYNGDLITNMEGFDADSVLFFRQTLTYNASNKLISNMEVEYAEGNSYGILEVYTYNSDGTVSTAYYSGDETSQTTLEETRTVHFQNGEISTIENVNLISGTTSTITYTYGTHLLPFPDVFGTMNIGFPLAEGEANSSLHNVLSEIYENDFSEPQTHTFEYQFDTEGYPTRFDESNDSGMIVNSMEYFYNH